MSAASALAAAGISLNDTLGAAFLGQFVTTILYGITTLQAFIYFRDQYKDPALFKASVTLVWILDTLHVGLITGAMYWYMVTNFTNLAAIQIPIWPIPTMIVISNISNQIVRIFFGYRLFVLSHRNWIFPVILAILSTYTIVDAFYFAAKLYKIDSYADIAKFSWSLYAGLSLEAATDIMITVAQCCLLRGFETGIRSTDHAIRLLITYSVNTGLLTSLCALGALISYAIAPTKFIYFAFYFCLSKLYVNSLLATLNARGSLLGRQKRKRAQVAIRTPSVTMERGASQFDPSHGGGIEFTTVISADAISTDSVVETTKTKIGTDESSPYGV